MLARRARKGRGKECEAAVMTVRRARLWLMVALFVHNIGSILVNLLLQYPSRGLVKDEIGTVGDDSLGYDFVCEEEFLGLD